MQSPTMNDVQQFIADTMARNKRLFGTTVMTAPAQPPAAPPAAPPPPANPGDIVIPVTFDTQTGEPIPAPQGAGPDGVWSGDVQPPTPPAPGVQQVAPPTGAPPVAPPNGAPYIEQNGQRFYTEQYLEQARAQEREKMHQRIETIEQRLAREQQEREAEIERQRQEAAQQAAEAERQRLGELPIEERLQVLQQTWEQRWAERDQADQTRAAMEDQERRFNGLMAYRSQRIAQEADLIHPTLVDLVASPETGATSEEQIEASITALKAKTDAIVGSVQEAQVQQRAAMPGVAPTGTPPVGPLDQTSGFTSLSPADIAAMDPATYAKNRVAIMEALRRQRGEKGLYGN
jgi:hypothetical protein